MTPTQSYPLSLSLSMEPDHRAFISGSRLTDTDTAGGLSLRIK